MMQIYKFIKYKIKTVRRNINTRDPTICRLLGPASSSSSASDSESQTGYKKPDGESTPTSVLPALNHEISPDKWPAVYAELVQAFKLIDRDDDGKIRKEELEALLSQVGAEPPTREELRLMLSESSGRFLFCQKNNGSSGASSSSDFRNNAEAETMKQRGSATAAQPPFSPPSPTLFSNLSRCMFIVYHLYRLATLTIIAFRQLNKNIGKQGAPF
nr:probable calcium-binding protein CML36 [Ipomoea batatas]